MGYEDAAPVVQSKALPPIPPIPQVSNNFTSENTTTQSEQQNGSPDSRTQSLRRKPIPGPDQPSIVLQASPPYNGEENYSRDGLEGRTSRHSGSSLSPSSASHSRNTSREVETPELALPRDSANSIPVTKSIPYRQLNLNNVSYNARHSHAAEVLLSDSAAVDNNSYHNEDRESFYETPTSSKSDSQVPEVFPPLQYHHQPLKDPIPTLSLGEPSGRVKSPSSDSQNSSEHSGSRHLNRPDAQGPRSTVPRPSSAYTLGSDLNAHGRTHSPHLSVGGSPSSNGSPISYGRGLSANRRSPESRPVSYVDLLNVPYPQQAAPSANLGNSALRHAVGANASLLDTKKTLEMYRANVKKTQDMAVQYEFALFMVQVAREVLAAAEAGLDDHGLSPAEMLREARQILQRLADRSYPFAQYYLGDGYASGLFNKDKPDYDRAFPLFVAASKHGHAEAGYRAALCYEFGWGCRKDYAKAVQFYRASASKNHPGAATRLGKACLTGDMGLVNRYREGLKWLKRATESADYQYNQAPYELGLLHETGYGDDIFKDEVYAVQLFTQAAELGHPQAALKLGEAYEHGLLCCPKDPALSVHYYNCAAQADIPEAMMNLCAWYMVGAEPVLEKDENEAYEWAKRAAEHGLPKAEYACGYFTEMGIGCRRDPLEANVWYVKAADHGDERAKQRLAIIRAAASGDPGIPASEKTKGKKGANDKDCIVM